MKSVAELRKSFKVFVKHRRYYQVTVDGTQYVTGPFTRNEAMSYGYIGDDMHAKGGVTEVDIFKGENLLASGGAVCCLKDSFVRKIGLNIALGRALERLDMVNWSEILSEVGPERLRAFCEGSITRREFESVGTNARRLVRTLGVDEARTRARKALARRTITN